MTEKPTPQPPSKNRRAATGQLDTFSEPRPRFRSGDLSTARAMSRPSPDRRAPRRHAEVLARGPRGVPRQVPAESRSAVDFGRRPRRPQSPPRYARGPTEVLAQDLPKRLGDGMPEYLPEVRANCHAGVAARVPIGRLSALSGVPAVFAAVLLRSPLRIRAKGRRRHGQVLARGSADVLAQALHDDPAHGPPKCSSKVSAGPSRCPCQSPSRCPLFVVVLRRRGTSQVPRMSSRRSSEGLRRRLGQRTPKDSPAARTSPHASPARRAPRRHAQVLSRGPRGVPRQVPARVPVRGRFWSSSRAARSPHHDTPEVPLTSLLRTCPKARRRDLRGHRRLAPNPNHDPFWCLRIQSYAVAFGATMATSKATS